jgi:predicted Zn finger-like uncharacterized protein
MFTRCPSCQSVYELEAVALAEAAGVVRCGNCGKTFNSLSHLFTEHPDAAASPIQGGGMPPLLEHRSMTQPELPGVNLGEDPEIETWSSPGPVLDLELSEPSATAGAHSAWKLATLALAAALLIQTIVHWQTPGSMLVGLFNPAAAGLTMADASETIQIVSRDMHRHPTLDDAVIISATLRNPSSHHLGWPVLEVRLYDPSQQVLGIRRLQPAEYLQNPDAHDRGMSPGLMIPVILEFVVGTTEPSGFDFRFH